MQKNKEQAFFESLAQKTGLPIEVDYKPIDTLGVKDTEQLRMMKSEGQSLNAVIGAFGNSDEFNRCYGG